MPRKYTVHSDQFKFKVALEALKGNKTVPELCQEFGLAAKQIYHGRKNWKKLVHRYLLINVNKKMTSLT